MFRRISLLAAIGLAACVFTGCEPCVIEQNMELTIPSDKYSAKVKGVKIEVSPKALKIGEKVRIDIEHEDGDTVEVIISSLSLAYNDTVTTPYLTKIAMDSVGLHGISFEVDGQKPESPAIIEVTK